MKMSEKSGKIFKVSQSTQNMIKKQHNMKTLVHEVWDEKEEMFIKSGLPEEPTLKIRMFVDVMSHNFYFVTNKYLFSRSR